MFYIQGSLEMEKYPPQSSANRLQCSHGRTVKASVKAYQRRRRLKFQYSLGSELAAHVRHGTWFSAPPTEFKLYEHLSCFRITFYRLTARILDRR